MRPNVMAWRQHSSRRSTLKHISHKRTIKIQLLHGRVGAQRLRNRLGSLRSDAVLCQRESVHEFRRGQEEMRPNATGVETTLIAGSILKYIIHKRTTKIQLLQRRVGAQRMRNRRGSSITNYRACETIGRESGQNTAKPTNSCSSRNQRTEQRHGCCALSHLLECI